MTNTRSPNAHAEYTCWGGDRRTERHTRVFDSAVFTRAEADKMPDVGPNKCPTCGRKMMVSDYTLLSHIFAAPAKVKRAKV